MNLSQDVVGLLDLFWTGIRDHGIQEWEHQK